MSDEALKLEEAARRFRKAFDTLDAAKLDLIKRVMLEPLSYEELSIRCDLPLAMVKEQIRSGLLHLQRMMGDDQKSD